jgi:hypothetical protein
VPDAAHEALRDLVRARLAAKRDQLRARHRLGKFLPNWRITKDNACASLSKRENFLTKSLSASLKPPSKVEARPEKSEQEATHRKEANDEEEKRFGPRAPSRTPCHKACGSNQGHRAISDFGAFLMA